MPLLIGTTIYNMPPETVWCSMIKKGLEIQAQNYQLDDSLNI